MPGHVQINSFAIYSPLLFVFVHLIDVGCEINVLKMSTKVCIRKWRTISLFFVYFFVLLWLFPRHDSLWLGSQSLFPFFDVCFLPLYLIHTCSLLAVLHISAASSLTLVGHSPIVVRKTMLLAL